MNGFTNVGCMMPSPRAGGGAHCVPCPAPSRGPHTTDSWSAQIWQSADERYVRIAREWRPMVYASDQGTTAATFAKSVPRHVKSAFRSRRLSFAAARTLFMSRPAMAARKAPSVVVP